MIRINGNDLTIDDVVAVARDGAHVDLDPTARERVELSQRWVREIADSQNPVY